MTYRKIEVRDGHLEISNCRIRKNWSRVERLRNGRVVIRDVAFMKLGTTTASGGFLFSRFGIKSGNFNPESFYDVRKTAGQFFKSDVISKWEGVPVLADSRFNFDRSNIVGRVRNARRYGRRLLCDLSISNVRKYRDAIDSGFNLVCTAYECSYRKVSGEDALIQENIVPSHLFMSSIGVPNMEFPLPEI